MKTGTQHLCSTLIIMTGFFFFFFTAGSVAPAMWGQELVNTKMASKFLNHVHVMSICVSVIGKISTGKTIKLVQCVDKIRHGVIGKIVWTTT